MAYLALELLNAAALIAMGIGFFWKDRRCHLLRAFAWTALGIHWVAKVPEYYAHSDAVNGLGAALALPIFLFLAYHEYRSYQWNDEYPPLRFVAGALFLAGTGYLIIGHVPIVRQLIIESVAYQSVWLANVFGYDFGVGMVTTEFTTLTGVPIQIILDCTAVQAFLVAGSFLFGCRGDWKRRLKALLIISPFIHLVNISRNAIVIILVYNNGADYFDFAHNYIGKTLSIVTLVILILLAFKIVPELYEDINGMFELPWRKGPKHNYLQFVGRLYGDEEEEASEAISDDLGEDESEETMEPDPPQ